MQLSDTLRRLARSLRARRSAGLVPPFLLLATIALAAPPPVRVVSVNLCTDQLALPLAAPGQLVSVTRMLQAEDTPLATEARALQGNSARAEEVYLLAPDLVLAGSFTAPDTLRMLRRLGLRVEVFTPAETLAGVGANITRMGGLLGREAEAAALVQSFNARLAAIEVPPGPAPLAALYAANGYSAGQATLPGQIVKAAGFALLAEELGLPYGGIVPLEILATAAPDLLIAARPAAPKSRAEEILTHPVIAALRETSPGDTLTDSDWTCGTPAVLDTVERLAAIRERMK